MILRAMRLFFAIPIPEAVRRELGRLRREVGKARWVPVEQLHVTLRFLGELTDEEAERVIERVELVHRADRWPAVRLAVRALGVFGPPRRPRVLFAHLSPEEPIRAIAASIERAVVEAGLPPEERPFAAHVTLARLTRPEPERVRALLEEARTYESAPFDVPEVVLYRSLLTPNGALHEAHRRFAIAS